MQTNVLPFPKPRQTGRKTIAHKIRDNVIQLDDWRDRSKIRRTNNGIFFVSNVLCFAGDAA